MHWLYMVLVDAICLTQQGVGDFCLQILQKHIYVSVYQF